MIDFDKKGKAIVYFKSQRARDTVFYMPFDDYLALTYSEGPLAVSTWELKAKCSSVSRFRKVTGIRADELDNPIYGEQWKTWRKKEAEASAEAKATGAGQ